MSEGAAPAGGSVLPALRALTMSWRTALFLLGACSLFIGVAAMDRSPVGAAGDDAMYVILARSLATGQGYRSLNLPTQPLNTHFPPGYPAALALLWWLAPGFPGNLMVFRLFNVVCVAAVTVATAHLAASRGVERGWALGAGAITAISVPVILLGNLLLSEPFFLALLLLLLVPLEAFVSWRGPVAWWRPVLLGIAVGLCSLVRTHGIVLVPALVVALVVHRRWRDASLIAVSALLCVLPWQLFVARNGNVLPAPLLGGYASYTAWWVRGLQEYGWFLVPRTLSRTIPEAAQMFAALFSPFRTGAALVTLVALGVLVASGISEWWRRIPVTLLFLGGYLIIVAVWPFQPSRFTWGVWPLVLLLMALGARAALRGGAHWHPALRLLVLAMCCWTGAGYARYEVRATRGRWWSSIPRSAAGDIAFAVGWTRANTGPRDIVATEYEGPVYLYTGRRTIPVRAFTASQYLADRTAEQEAHDGLVPLLAAYPVRAVLVSTRLARNAAAVLSQGPAPLLAARGEFAGGAAYAVRPR